MSGLALVLAAGAVRCWAGAAASCGHGGLWWRAAEEPASLPLGEPVRRTSCPGVKSGAHALKELKEERQGVASWFSASPMPQNLRLQGDSCLQASGQRGPSSRAEARLKNLFREAPTGSCVGGRAAAWRPAPPRNRPGRRAASVHWVGLGLSRSQAGLYMLTPPAASRRDWQSCGHRAGCVLPPLLAAGPAGLWWSVVGRAWWF